MFMKVQDTTDLAASLLVAVRGDERVRFDRDSSFREAVISDNPGDKSASRFEEGRRSTKSTLLNRSVHTKLSWRYKVCAVGEIAETVGNAERSAFRGPEAVRFRPIPQPVLTPDAAAYPHISGPPPAFV